MEGFEDMIDVLLLFSFYGGLAFIVAQMSKERDIGFWTLFAVSMFFTPFAGIIIGFIAKKKRNPNEPPSPQEIKQTQEKFWERFVPTSDDKASRPVPPPVQNVQTDRRGSKPRHKNKPKRGNGGLSV